MVVHNECFADVSDKAFIDKVIAPHRDGVPAVVIHCATHTFRSLKSGYEAATRAGGDRK